MRDVEHSAQRVELARWVVEQIIDWGLMSLGLRKRERFRRHHYALQ